MSFQIAQRRSLLAAVVLASASLGQACNKPEAREVCKDLEATGVATRCQPWPDANQPVPGAKSGYLFSLVSEPEKVAGQIAVFDSKVACETALDREIAGQPSMAPYFLNQCGSSYFVGLYRQATWTERQAIAGALKLDVTQEPACPPGYKWSGDACVTPNGKVAQCNALIEAINREQGPLKNASGSDPPALKRLATTLREVASRVGATDLTDVKLVELRDSYARMTQDLATASDATATALEERDPTRAAEAAKTMSSFGTRESDLIERINVYCSGSP